jgi:predicted RNA-binding Zn-ribbon protein involved in translation (DUF1610 family)
MPVMRRGFYETTEHYVAGKMPNTSMCRLKEPYKSWGWHDFYTPPPGEGIGWMECPQCGAPLVMVDRLLLRETQSKSVAKRLEAQKKEPEAACPQCGKPESDFKTRGGFAGHKSKCKGASS